MKKNLGNIISWSSVVIVIMSIYSYNVQIISLAIILAAIMDMFDGKFARMYGEDTQEAHIFGEVTDSLCDLINFGVAPSLIMTYIKFASDYQISLLIASCFFVWAGIYRLARFSATKTRSVGNETIDYYTGLPITVAGPLVGIFVATINQQAIILFIIILFAWSMITKYQVKKLKI